MKVKPLALAIAFTAGVVTGAIGVAAWWAYKPRQAKR